MRLPGGDLKSSVRSLWTVDVLLFVLLLAGYALGLAIRVPLQMGAFIVLSALAMIVLYLRTTQDRTRMLLVIAAIAAIAVAPTVLGIYLRHMTVPYDYVHDGAIQTEEAIKFLLAGKNPYVENYLNTPLAQWWVPGPGEASNPALYHLVYLPFLFVSSAPFYIVAQSLAGWFDERMVFLPLFIVMLVLVPRLAQTRSRQRALLLAVGLNPLFVPFLAEGRNDVFILSWIVMSVVALETDHRILSVIALAFACATKQTAWFILPFYAIYFIGRDRLDWHKLRSVDWTKYLVPLGVFAVVFGIFILPFFFWNQAAFIEDVYTYTAGSGDMAYPIRSLGLGGIGLALGWISSPTAAFPFSLLQVLFGVPVLGILVYAQMKRNTPTSLWLCYGLLTGVIAFFSRVFNDNHIGYILSLLAIGVLSQQGPRPRRTYDVSEVRS